jgi:uncharacterized protein YdaU (DUF1376 family)
MHYYPHHIGDFLRDTVSLTPQESYFYLRLIWLYYESEKPLPNDIEALAFKIGARGNEESLSLLLRTFFTYESDLNSYTHQRIDGEISKYQRKANSARGANQIRWTLEKDKKSDLKSDADQIPTNNQQPITNNQQPNINTRSASSLRPDDVDESVWADFKALRKAKKSPITDTAIKGIRKEASNAGISLEKALQLCCARGWQGFKAEWVTDDLKKDDHYKQSLDIIFGRNRREKDITPRQDLLEG